MKRFKDILCVVETQGVSKSVLERAVSLSQTNHANLTVVTVVEPITAGIGMRKSSATAESLQAKMLDKQGRELETLVNPYRKNIKIETIVLVGIPFLEIIREVLRNGHDLVIKIPDQHEWLDRIFGSDDMHLLRKCPCPVWLVKPHAPNTYKRILAAVDVDDDYPTSELESRQALNRQILELASSVALAESGDLHIGHAWDAIGENHMRYGALVDTSEDEVKAYVEQVGQLHNANLQSLLRDMAAGESRDALDYLKPQTHLVKGWARKVIPLLAKEIEADLAVMGTVGRTGVPGFIMGNTAETILNQIECSVLAIKPPGFVTPVTLED